jgi:hypothetical protein
MIPVIQHDDAVVVIDDDRSRSPELLVADASFSPCIERRAIACKSMHAMPRSINDEEGPILCDVKVNGVNQIGKGDSGLCACGVAPLAIETNDFLIAVKYGTLQLSRLVSSKEGKRSRVAPHIKINRCVETVPAEFPCGTAAAVQEDQVTITLGKITWSRD